MKYFIFLCTAALAAACSAPQTPAYGQSSAPDYFGMIRGEVTGDTAFKTTAFVEQYWRVAGNTGFDATVRYLAERLEKAGFVPEEKAGPKDQLRYRIEKRPMEHPTWEPVDASLTLAGESEPLLQSAANRNMIAMYSASTPAEGVTGDVVFIQNMEEIKPEKVKGRIVFAEMDPGRLFRKAVIENGALGLLTYDMPDYLQPEKNVTSIQFRDIPYDKDHAGWAVPVSYAAKEKLKAVLAKGPVTATVKIRTKIYPSEELTLVADALGTKTPDQRLVFSAHIQEPGANDNASGVGAQLEMALTTARLIQSGQLDLDRTITFLWGDEIISTKRYIQDDKTRAKGIKWGISLDMVGENTDLTGGSFLIEKMPDPSAIWTRGADQHTEWGASPMTLKDMKPHYFNDFILRTFKAQGQFAGWVVNANPFEGGSDHTPFIRADIPGLLLWHFTDQFYHTDNDRIDKVSQNTLKNVATGALAAAYTLVNADEQTALRMVEDTRLAAADRLNTEMALSREAVGAGKAPADEVKIITAWKDWYLAAIGSVADIRPAQADSAGKVDKAIRDAQQSITVLAESYLAELKK
ncbi:MAG TPA: M28 family peptidase [Flavilitoribacter sp.]|nr:M28 family peptidase [Flavilitoribacter sp.]HMQ89661.1 M28 family peptidase [Flavilitoribacter sp.]